MNCYASWSIGQHFMRRESWWEAQTSDFLQQTDGLVSIDGLWRGRPVESTLLFDGSVGVTQYRNEYVHSTNMAILT